MNKPDALRSVKTSYLSVIHKAAPAGSNIPSHHHAVIQTDLHFSITGWNAVAEEMHGRPGAMGKNLLSLIDIEFTGSSRDRMLDALKQNGFWSGEICYRRYDGQKFDLLTTATHIINEKEEPVAIMIVSHIINDIKHKEEQLEASEIKFEAMVNTLPHGVVMMDATGRIITCNKKGAEILGLTEEEILGKVVASPSWKAIRADGSEFPVHQFPAVVSLQTGFPQRNVIMGIEQPGGNLVWLSVNSEALIKPGEFDPYAAVVSFSDITHFVNTEKELLKSNERFYYVNKLTSDAIWDFDIAANTIYRSDAFNRLSGYPPEQISANLNWWFDKIHPDDQERVKRKLDEQLFLHNEKWEDEYRFEYADGSYKVLCDSGIILYRDSKPVRILGSIRDVTEEKMLKEQLAKGREQKQKAITLAALQAQEQEKTKISRELHDNVNQILMSAKLYMDTARRSPDEASALLDKAIEYQLLALHEIRKLSRSLSAPGISTAGLKDSIGDIVHNLRALQDMEVDLNFENALEQRLNTDEKLTIYRIIQEQTSNIIKYAGATEVTIEAKQKNGELILSICDNGKGFDPSSVDNKGIGLINMRSRAEAHSGKLTISSSPDKGCKVQLAFPLG
ncbi:MAG: PAS domain S-box protein [Bacteroidota bacterium]